MRVTRLDVQFEKKPVGCMNRTPWGRCPGERKTGAGQAGMTPGALTWESVSVRLPLTKEEERIKTAGNRAHLCAKHCSRKLYSSPIT